MYWTISRDSLSANIVSADKSTLESTRRVSTSYVFFSPFFFGKSASDQKNAPSRVNYDTTFDLSSIFSFISF